MPQLIPAAIGTGLQIFGAIKGSKPQTSTTTRTLSPEYQAVMSQLLGYNEATMKDPAKGLAPVRLNAMENINRRYAGAGDRIQTALAKRGYARSGKAPGAFTNLETSRLSDFSNLESEFAKIGSDRQQQAAGQLQQILQSMIGTTSTGPGNPGAGLMQAGSSLGNLSGLLMMSKMLGGGGGGGETSLPMGYDPGSYRPPGFSLGM